MASTSLLLSAEAGGRKKGERKVMTEKKKGGKFVNRGGTI